MFEFDEILFTTIAIYLGICYFLYDFKHPKSLISSGSLGVMRFGLPAAIGVAIGNIFDRVYYYAVPDFIDFHIGNFHWFIFNIADIFITFGIIALILIELTKNKKKTENV